MTSKVTLEIVSPFADRTEATWRLLEAEARPPYFLSWAWMENWLACLPRDKAPPAYVFMDEDRPVAACFVGTCRIRRHGFVESRALYLNATGMRPYDSLCLEHNALLTREPSVSLATIVALLPGTWDELYLPCLDRDAFHALATTALSGAVRVCVDREVADPYIDLEQVRQQGYIPLLGASTRAQLRKAQRSAGELVLEVAGDLHQAMDIYDEMVPLHQQSWVARGERGAFADPWFDHFHRRLIANRFDHGELLLTRLRANGTTLGCLYSFVSQGRALFYQSGLAASDDRHMKPGYLCHAHTIEHCAAAGLDTYDFLGGDARYKQNLATQQSRLVWARVQRLRVRFVLEEHARAWVRARRERVAARASSGSAAATR